MIDDNILIKAARQFGTPCLCYEEKEILFWEKALRDALPPSSRLIYSVKASPSPALLKHYIRSGLYFETASEGELLTLLSLGTPPEKIWVSGQGKTKRYLVTAVKNGIHRFHLESINELSLLAPELKAGEEYECCLRINPASLTERSALQTGGRASAFGTDEARLEEILNGEYGKLLTGIFVYAGSQLFYAQDIINNTKYVFDLAKKFYHIAGRPLLSVDFGGGFGVPESDDVPELDLRELNKGLSDLFEENIHKPYFTEKTGFYFESGRYLAARTACLVTSVVDIKESHGEKFIITDGGINQLGVKQMEYRIYPPYIRHIGKKQSDIRETYKIVGNTCTPIDLTHPGIDLGPVSIGDHICVMDCGAYSLSFSPNGFNGRYSTPEVLHSGNDIIGLVERGGVCSLLHDYNAIAINTHNEINELLVNSCPISINEANKVVMAVANVKINKLDLVLYDVCGEDAQSIILLKVLKKYYNVIPCAVFTNDPIVSRFTDAPCYPLNKYSEWTSARKNMSKYYALFIGAESLEGETLLAVEAIIRSGIKKYTAVDAGLIGSSERKRYLRFILNADHFQKIIDMMADVKSKQYCLEYMRTVLENDCWRDGQSALTYGLCPEADEVFGIPPYKRLEGECWLNIGTCLEDSIVGYILGGHSFSHIYAVDRDLDNLSKSKQALDSLLNGELLDKISFLSPPSGKAEWENQIDDMFSDSPISLMTVNTESAEAEIIKSASSLIRRSRPVLEVLIYKNSDDLFDLSEIISILFPDYLLFLRYYKKYPADRSDRRGERLILYALPPERLAE